MKAIKIIVVLISIIVVGFLSIGLLIKETQYTTSVKIEKPLAFVYTEFNDTSKRKEWITDFKSIEILEEKLGKTGSTYKVTVNNNGQDMTMKEKILAFIPNEKVTLFYDAGKGSMLKTNDYIFTSEGDATKITHKGTCRSSGYLMACMFPFFKSKFKKQDQGYLNNLKVFLENE